MTPNNVEKPAPRSLGDHLWPHLATAVITIGIQLIAAAYVYGQLSAVVTAHSQQIKDLQQLKLDASIYYREHPIAGNYSLHQEEKKQ